MDIDTTKKNEKETPSTSIATTDYDETVKPATSRDTLVQSLSYPCASCSISVSPSSSTSTNSIPSLCSTVSNNDNNDFYVSPSTKRSRGELASALSINDGPFAVEHITTSTAPRPKGFRKRDHFDPEALNLAFSRDDWCRVLAAFVILFVVSGMVLLFYMLFTAKSFAKEE